ncbi:hypothetical protein FO519_004196 [Halicephalobus sp. NKZ332]|nr:hypothetical protein FO519_004196 [Halicephalobus sp. NKZ332]
MGCSESKSQIAPLNLYDEPIEKLFSVNSAVKVEEKESLHASLSTFSDSPRTKVGLYEKRRQESLEKLETSLQKRQLTRRKSLDSNCSATGSLPESSSDFPRMSILENYSIDTSRAKSNIHVVSMCAKKLGMEEYPEGRNDGKPSSVYWHSIVYGDMKIIVKSPDSRVNKFPGMTELAKKISLTQSIRSMQELFPDEYNFYPKSWVIPAQLNNFKEYCASNKNQSWFIVKPDDGAQGTGIYLATSPEQLANTTDKQLIQEYIDEPFLMADKLKFDFRVYAVIKSINPLSIYIAREGMARFCTEKYAKPTSSNFENLYSHLTNYSLNKENSSYVHSNTLKDQLKGSKRLLSTVFHQMETHGVRTRRLWHGIKMIVVKTVLAMVPEIMLNYEHYFSDSPGAQCFQIMGFDILVKKDGTPMLLEVNSAPSLSIDHNVYSEDASPPVRSIVDEMIKVPLVRDTLLLVLNQLENQYNVLNSSEWDTKSLNSMASAAEDDLAMIRKKKRPHLSEIFPGRFGAASKHLLFLDKAVYLFMQFATVRLSMTINLMAVKNFIKKCSLSKTISSEELEQKYIEINYYFTGKENNTTTGLPFHGFLQLLFHLSALKFGFCDDLLAAMQRLLAYCDSALRHYGVRSTRLRRTEIETDENENHLEIYLLPSRIRQPKASAVSLPNPHRSHRDKSSFLSKSTKFSNVEGSLSIRKTPIFSPMLNPPPRMISKSLPRKQAEKDKSAVSATPAPTAINETKPSTTVNGAALNHSQNSHGSPLPRIGVVH